MAPNKNKLKRFARHGQRSAHMRQDPIDREAPRNRQERRAAAAREQRDAKETKARGRPVLR